MYSSVVEEVVARYGEDSSSIQLLPSVLSSSTLDRQPTAEAATDTDLDLEAADLSKSTPPDPSSYTSSSRSSVFTTDVEDEEYVEEVVRDAPLRRQDLNHDVLRSRWGLAAPRNFGQVMPGIYRSGFPQAENINFLKTLNLKTILTLVPEQYPQQLNRFVDENGIRHIKVSIEPNKDPFVVIPQRNMVAALGVVLNRANHPMLIHCNKGKHRTGCVVGCFRKVLGWDTQSISAEYNHYAGSKARPLDERFIDRFDDRAMLWLARENNFLVGTEPIYESPISALVVSTRLRS